MKNLEVFINPASGRNAIYIIARNGHKVIDLDNILCCIADRNYSKIILEEEKLDIVVPKSLCVLESELKEYNFLRCSSSYIINLKKAGSFNRYLRKIYLNSHIISISNRKCGRVLPILTAFGFKEILKR